MKRPHGFDRQPAPRAPAEPRTPPEREVREPTALPVRPPSRRIPRSTVPSNREIRGNLRRAQKDRARFERGEVRRFTRRSRQRRIAWLTALATLVVLVLGVAITAFSPLMAVRTIEVAGTARVKKADITSALHSQLGRPLPFIGFADVKAELARFPLIRSFSLESRPPGTLVVRIVERTPVGVVPSAKGFQVVDPAMVVIATSAQRPSAYPLILASGSRDASGRPSGFDASVAVLEALPANVLSTVDTVTASTTDDVSFTVRGTGATVVWGSADQSDLKAADLAALIAAAGSAKTSVYDVSSPHSVVRK